MGKEIAKAIATFFIVLMVFIAVFAVSENRTFERNRDRYEAIAVNQSNIIRWRIEVIMSRVYSLRSLTIASDGNTDFFDKTAEQILRETERRTNVKIKSLALAPDGVVSEVYPMEGNEQLLGFDLLDTALDGNDVDIDTYEKGELVITDPYNYNKGGLVMSGRLPVFIEENGESKFWGIVAINLDYDKFLEAISIDVLNDIGINYFLWYSDGKGVVVNLCSSRNLPLNSVRMNFSMYNLIWHLEIAPQEGWYSKYEYAVAIISMIAFSLAVAFLVFASGRLKLANKSLEQLAFLDNLTGCYSRHYVESVLLNSETGEWKNTNVKYSLVIVDIDKFKSINDEFGHNVGDMALERVGRILNRNIRKNCGDCVIRHGGDEFIILYNNVSRERLHQKLSSIIDGVRQLRFSGNPLLRVTISMGAIHHEDTEGLSYFEMVKAADDKLYESKEGGRDRFIE